MVCSKFDYIESICNYVDTRGAIFDKQFSSSKSADEKVDRVQVDSVGISFL